MDATATLVARVGKWAQEHAANDYNYCSRASYWGAALAAGIITQSEYEIGREYYGHLWTYVGD